MSYTQQGEGEQVKHWRYRRRLYNRRSELAAAQIGTNDYGYAYDTIGNRVLSSVNATTYTYTANNLNQYTQVGRDAPIAPPVAFSYDADGNMTNDGRFTYTFDAENRLVSACPIVPAENALAVEHAYDHRHHRIRKTVKRYNGAEWQLAETHDFVWDGNNIILEAIAFADGTMRTCEYFWGNDLSGAEQGAGGVGGLVAVSVDGAFYIPCYDHNGNIVCYVSESGTIAAQYVYDPYGNVIEAVGSDVDIFSFGFSTKYLDRETGMLAYQLRYYLPDHGRWLNRDPIEEQGSENLYGFCKNRPVFLLDKLGLSCKVGTYNVLRLDTWDKPMANGLSSNPDLFSLGDSLLSSIGTLGNLMSLSSLSPDSLANFQSFVDAMTGNGMTPDADVMARLRELYDRLKSGPLSVHGILEYEVCVCKGKKTTFERQEDIQKEDEVLDGGDRMAVQRARQSVLKEMIDEMFSKIRKLSGR